ncbi:MAG TPA: hypothetical protein PKK26_01880 [Candidatus Wallbacteria bacterium]|nr:hypothetical protein [Candidatus Wallbacteria bacterium]
MYKKIVIILMFLFLAGFVFSAAAFALENDPPANAPAGKVFFTASWGAGAGHVGAASPEFAVCDFISPTSFITSGDRLYILDAPNYRLNCYGKDRNFEWKYDLEKKIGSQTMLYTDLAVMPDESVVVSSSREKVLYKISRDGKFISKIKPAFEVKTIMRIASDISGNILIEDSDSEKMFLMDGAGSLMDSTNITNAQTLLLSGARCLKLEMPSESQPPFKAKARIFKFGKELPVQLMNIEFDKQVQNLIALGETADRSIMIYAVLGSAQDAPTDALVLKLGPDGKTVSRIDAPISPEMLTMRYVRMKNDNEVLFASGNEDGYVISSFDFPGKK